MAGDRAATGEDHAPGQVCGPPEEFAVDEIAQPSQTKANGDGDDVEVDPAPEVDLVAAGKEPAAHDHREAGPVKAHSSLPGGQNLQGVAQVIGQVVEQDIPQAAADNDRENQDQIEVFKMGGQVPAVVAADLLLDQEIAGRKAQDIHQSVPADLQGAHGEDDRVDVREGDHGLGGWQLG